MAAMVSAPGTNDPERQVEESSPPASAVRAALRHVLESQPFRTSKQCQDLLRYIVDRSLSGDDASLRERVIGTEVFGRKPTYDTGEDPVVRVRAADVRKRLAQYYQSHGSGDLSLHIELQPGLSGPLPPGSGAASTTDSCSSACGRTFAATQSTNAF